MRCSVPLGYLAGKSSREIIALSATAGIVGLEGGPELPAPAGDLDSFVRALDQAALRIESFHLPTDHDLASLSESDRTEAVRVQSGFLEMAASLGASVAIQHPTSNYDRGVDVESFDPLLGQLAKSLSVLLPRAADLGLVLALENIKKTELGEPMFGATPEHFRRFDREFADPHFGHCYDTSHALLACGRDGALELLDAMLPRLEHVHLNDSAGDHDEHLPPGRGVFDWTTFAASFTKANLTRCVCIEARPSAGGPDYPAEAWKRLIDDTVELLGGVAHARRQ
jgi:sugar phosphate isomerase/epimerase